MRRGIRLMDVLLVTCVGCCYAVHIALAQTLIVTPGRLDFTATADSLILPAPQGVGVAVLAGDKLEFKFNGFFGTTNFVVVSPSSGVSDGVSSTGVGVALNPNVVPYLPSGSYAGSIGFATPGQTSGPYAGALVTLNLKFAGQPIIQSVSNAATLQPDISPGEMVSIFGAHLGTAAVTAQYDSFGLFPTDLSRRDYSQPSGSPHDGVTFNSIAAPLLYYSPNQINALVPYGVAGQTSVSVVVTHNGSQSVPFSLPVKDTSPGIFTVGQNGSGQGAIFNAGSTPNAVTLNSADNPAPKGSVITLFATGFGIWDETIPDGSVLFGGGLLCDPTPPLVSTGCKTIEGIAPVAPVSLTIGGQSALLLFVGPAPGTVSGMLQVNAFVPSGIGTGPQPVVLTAGTNSNSQQQVTVAVK